MMGFLYKVWKEADKIGARRRMRVISELSEAYAVCAWLLDFYVSQDCVVLPDGGGGNGWNGGGGGGCGWRMDVVHRTGGGRASERARERLLGKIVQNGGLRTDE
jgi:hypothetical protein